MSETLRGVSQIQIQIPIPHTQYKYVQRKFETEHPLTEYYSATIIIVVGSLRRENSTCLPYFHPLLLI